MAIVTVVAGRVVGAVACLGNTHAAGGEGAHRGRESNGPGDSLGHVFGSLIVHWVVFDQGAASAVAGSRGHWS
jgi:hypothetical protein